MKSKISMRKASNEAKRVGMVRMKRPSRKRGEWAGEWKCEATASEKHISASRAAMGWIISMYDMEWRVAELMEKSPLVAFLGRTAAHLISLWEAQAGTLPIAHTGIVADFYLTTRAIIRAVAPDSIGGAFVGSERDALYHGRRQGGDQQQHKRNEEEKGQRRCWA
jgi:hypothetical protein